MYLSNLPYSDKLPFSQYWPYAGQPYEKTSTRNPYRILHLYECLKYNTLYTPFQFSDGSVYQWMHSSFASGLLWTQIGGSQVNALMTITSFLASGCPEDVIRNGIMKFQGDDSAIALNWKLSETNFEKFLNRVETNAYYRFGSRINASKTCMSRNLSDLTILGYSYKDGGKPYRALNELIAKLIKPERSHAADSLGPVAIGLAYANCGAHRWFYDMCKFVYEIALEKSEKDKFNWRLVKHYWIQEFHGVDFESFKIDPGFPTWEQTLADKDYTRTEILNRNYKTFPAMNHARINNPLIGQGNGLFASEHENGTPVLDDRVPFDWTYFINEYTTA